MTTGLVLDASAVAKWFVEEDESEEMRRIRDLHINGIVIIYIPSLLFVELSNALRYIGGLTPTDVINAIEALKTLHLKVVSDLEVLDRAIEIAFNHSITVYDAIYVALARATGSKLITYDKELLSKFSNIAGKASQIIKELSSTL